MIRRRKQKKSGFQITERLLIRYLTGKILPEERHYFEMLMEQDPFLRDALEGLSALDKDKIPVIIFQLNTLLNKQLKQKSVRPNFFFNQKLLVWVTILIILLFVFVTWWYIKIVLP